jgi:Icc-related predicted phosphoesterase
MKILFTADLHGEIHLYQELLELTLSSSTEIIALGGDLLPSFPPTKRYEDMIPNQKTFINRFLSPFFKRMVETTSVRQIFLLSGNWDLGYAYLFKEPIEEVIDLNQKSYQLKNGYELIGYPFVPPTPFRPKDYEKMDDLESAWPPQKNPSYIRSSDQTDQLISIDPYLYLRGQGTIQDDLDQLPKPFDYQRTIFIMHSPPFGTHLDCIEGGRSAGSRSIRAFIEKNQPLLTLHGHIHESPEVSGTYFNWIEQTLCINPGQFAWINRESFKLNAITFEIESLELTLRHTLFPQIPITIPRIPKHHP